MGTPPLTLTDRLEIAGARAVAALPRGAKRRIAGSPIRRDGLELDLDMQLLVKLDERELRAPLSSGTPAKAREDLRRAMRVVAGPPIELAEVVRRPARERPGRFERACSCRARIATRAAG